MLAQCVAKVQSKCVCLLQLPTADKEQEEVVAGGDGVEEEEEEEEEEPQKEEVSEVSCSGLPAH